MDADVKELLLAPDGHRLGVWRTRGELVHEVGDTIAWVLVERGEGLLRVDDEQVAVDGRTDVFERAGWSATAPAGSVVALEGTLECTLVFRPGSHAVPARLIPPEAVVEEERGSGANARRVRTYLPEGPLIAGETLNPPGGWSSYPPHRHEHEEVYVYHFEPTGGFGIAINYDDTREEAMIVHDGHVQRIASGYHPVAAAPGYAMYYLWALAGESHTLAPTFDPAHAWLA
jgi:5-deoxy-glucuronate isomerase